MKQPYSILLSWLTLIAMVFTGCAPPAGAPAVEQAPTQEASPAANEDQPEPIRLATAYTLAPLDPALAVPGNEATSSVLRALYQTLVMYAPDDFSTITGDLAESWAFSDDFTTLTFYLRQGRQFTDGNPVTAADVVFSLNRLKEKNGSAIYLAETIDVVEAIDDYTVVLKLTRPDPAMLNKLTTEAFSIINTKQVEAQGDGFLSEGSAGSGPYSVAKWSPEEVVLEPSSTYPFDESFVTFPRVSFLPRTLEMQGQSLQSGDIDIALDVSTDQLEMLQQYGDVSVNKEPSLALIYLATNLRHTTQLQDPRVQEAIRYALDYDGIRHNVLRGEAQIPASFIPQGFPGVIEREIQHTPDKARQLLAEAGYDPEQTASLAYNDLPYLRTLATVIGENLRNVGIKVDIVAVDPSIDLTQENTHYDLLLLWKTPNYPQVQDYLNFLPGGAIANAIGWQDPEFAKLREAALSELDPTTLATILKTAQQNIIKNGPYAFVSQPIRITASRGLPPPPRDARGVVYTYYKNPCPCCYTNPDPNCCYWCKRICGSRKCP